MSDRGQQAIMGIIEAMKDLPETEKARLQGYGEGVAAMKQKMEKEKEKKAEMAKK